MVRQSENYRNLGIGGEEMVEEPSSKAAAKVVAVAAVAQWNSLFYFAWGVGMLAWNLDFLTP